MAYDLPRETPLPTNEEDCVTTILTDKSQNSIGKSAFLATDHASQNGEMPWMPPI